MAAAPPSIRLHPARVWSPSPCQVSLLPPARARPGILGTRTCTEQDIFYNAAEGLPRAERDLAAAASRSNGCIYCASVHARFAATYSKRDAAVDRLLVEGVDTDLGERWIERGGCCRGRPAGNPVRFGVVEIARLRAAGLDDLDIADVIHAASFFNWANQLMLSLGSRRFRAELLDAFRTSAYKAGMSKVGPSSRPAGARAAVES